MSSIVAQTPLTTMWALHPSAFAVGEAGFGDEQRDIAVEPLGLDLHVPFSRLVVSHDAESDESQESHRSAPEPLHRRRQDAGICNDGVVEQKKNDGKIEEGGGERSMDGASDGRLRVPRRRYSRQHDESDLRQRTRGGDEAQMVNRPRPRDDALASQSRPVAIASIVRSTRIRSSLEQLIDGKNGPPSRVTAQPSRSH